MASFSLSQFLLPPRWNSKFILSGSLRIVQIPQYDVSSRLILSSSSKSKVVMSVAQGETTSSNRKAPRAKGTTSRGVNKASKVTQQDNSQQVEETHEKPKRPTPSKATSASAEEKVEKKRRGRKSKKSVVDKGEAPDSDDAKVSDVDSGILTASEDDVEKTEKKSRGRKSRKNVNKMDDQRTDAEIEVGIYNSDEDDAGSKTEKKSRGRRSKKKVDVISAEASDAEASDVEGSLYVSDEDFSEEIDLELLDKDEDDGISSTYSWPPLICCFGAAQYCFVPSGRPANRLVDYEIHQRMKDALWEPDNFVRAPGGSAGSVAIALANLGCRVAFMGKLGDDDFGQSMLYYLNGSNVQTRAVSIDTRRRTAVSKMKIVKRGGLRMTSSKPCAEDSLTKTEISIDLLKEAKMFYLSTSSLLDQNMRKTTLRALRIAKKLGSVIFYDLNLPFPLWQSSEETKAFIQQVWNLADIIEVTNQELGFLCGITPCDTFQGNYHHPSKFIHYEPDVIAPLWHENLKVLFVTNGTSKLHYYTKDQDGAVVGVEDAPITPYTSDMSASGDGIVAALMKMLAVQPHLITDKDYLEHALKYAINCGVIDQWILGRQRGFPAMEGMEEEASPDQYGITSLTEREFRTVTQVQAVELFG